MVGEGVKILAKSPRFETRVTAKVPGPGIGASRGNHGQDLAVGGIHLPGLPSGPCG
jgi:hypothetical protein